MLVEPTKKLEDKINFFFKTCFSCEYAKIFDQEYLGVYCKLKNKGINVKGYSGFTKPFNEIYKIGFCKYFLRDKEKAICSLKMNYGDSETK